MITFLITFHFENCETLILHGSKSSRNSSSPAAGRNGRRHFSKEDVVSFCHVICRGEQTSSSANFIGKGNENEPFAAGIRLCQ